MKRLSISMFILISIFLTNCRTNGNFEIESGYRIDSSFKLKDSLTEIICIKNNLKDSNGLYSINFHYYIKEKDKWVLKNKFDSLESWSDKDLLTDHTDFNQDGVLDFNFLAEQGIRGANFWDNIILYDAQNKNFTYLKGSRLICAPWFDKVKKRLIGINTFGGQYALSEYKIEKDTTIEISKEIWQGDSLIKKLK